MGVLKNKKVIVIFLVVLAIIILTYTQYIAPISFSIESVNWYITDQMEFDSIKYMYTENFPDPDIQYINEFAELPSENPNDYMKVFYNIKVKNKSLFDVVGIESLVDEIYKYKDRFLYSVSSSHTLSNSVDRFSNSMIYCDLYIYVAGLSENEREELLKSLSLKLIYKTNFWGTRTENVNTKNVNRFINSPYIED
ncbi:hypothetical protein [Acetivibrio clariflavus]|uniref:Uncharacterized protein n=1 Tax=Acetivibrio clariflavus (strain DSM 19732 / NBRC 101661 / EBR45) TaxID=720554 RepID=G8LXP0_ACECE|nr:hypothetical protein [Acetivibrio clariflavus]AEV67751.1 hypothetical protein Clocl_1076 [Acetivibrio clariflavus DSM 19732]